MVGLMTFVSAVTQVGGLFGLFDWGASRASRLVGAAGRTAESLVTATPSATLIVGRLEFMASIVWAGWIGIEPFMQRLADGESLTLGVVAMGISGFIKAVLRYRTTHAVA